MNATERIRALLAGKETDRIAGTFWKHIPLHDRVISDFVAKTLSMQQEYGQDVMKLCCNGYYMQEDWGCGIQWPTEREVFPDCLHRAINDPSQWMELQPLDVKKGALAREIESARRVVELCNGRTPVLATVFSPLKVALEMTASCLCPEVINAQIQYHPKEVEHGLEVITEVTRRYIEAMCDAGVDGIFFATQAASADVMSLDAFLHFGKKYDLAALQVLKDSTWFNMLHIHNNRHLYFEQVEDYPVQALNWEDLRSDLSLEEARKKTSKILMGGIDQHADFYETDRERLKELLLSRILEGRRRAGPAFIAAPGCVMPNDIPENRYYAWREALEACAK